jgi:hypothetical protein
VPHVCVQLNFDAHRSPKKTPAKSKSPLSKGVM